MSSKTLGNLMKFSVVAMSICGLFLCLLVIPAFGESIMKINPEFTNWFWPWIIFSWILAIPCFVIMVYVWKVSNSVIQETVFTFQTAKWVKAGAMLLFFDGVFLFIGSIGLFLFNMNHPGVLLIFIVVDIFVVTLALFMAILSRYLTKASILQEESEGIL